MQIHSKPTLMHLMSTQAQMGPASRRPHGMKAPRPTPSPEHKPLTLNPPKYQRPLLDTQSVVLSKPQKPKPSAGADAAFTTNKPPAPAPTPPTPAPTPQSPPSTPQPTPQLTIRGLMAAWGQSGSEYDFDQDGTVNVNDLLHFINNWAKFNPQPSGPSETTADHVTAAEDATSLSTDAQDVSTSDSIDATPSTSATNLASDQQTADVNKTISVSDFQSSVDSITDAAQTQRGSALNAPAARAALSLGDSPAATHSLGGLTALSDKLFEQLTAAGFEKHPPINLPDLIGTLNLAPRQSQFLLKQFAERYPEGLGVNMVG